MYTREPTLNHTTNIALKVRTTRTHHSSRQYAIVPNILLSLLCLQET